ncbi:DUF305 domain-containing protein [Polaromonas sp. YR568]|uniref:DUF305 domain-containing protein n=1 Tax=Polaromonas sp. YR568 TaxID=1855301 RepID=UPI00398BDF84
MKWGRLHQFAFTPFIWLMALSAAIIVIAGMPGAGGEPFEADAAARHDHVAEAMAGSMCTSTGAGSDFQRDMEKGMGRMMADMHSPGYSGNVDADFLAMMVPHHQGAVDMARLVLVHGRDPATRMLAEEIIAGQTIEIQSMQRRLALLREPDRVVAESEFPVLGGTRGP